MLRLKAFGEEEKMPFLALHTSQEPRKSVQTLHYNFCPLKMVNMTAYTLARYDMQDKEIPHGKASLDIL